MRGAISPAECPVVYYRQASWLAFRRFLISGANTMTVTELEEAYQQLRDQLLNGDISDDSFRAMVEMLRYEDDRGNEWKIGWYTGKWYRYDRGQWIQGTPAEGAGSTVQGIAGRTLPAKDQARRRLPKVPCLVIALIGLLLAASALLIFGWNADWWQRAPEATAVAAEATQAEETTAPPTATATSLPTASPVPSDTPSPTATPRPSATPTRRTATATATQTNTPAPTATPRPTSGAAPTTGIRPTATPSLSGRIYFPVYDPNPDRRTFDIYVVDLATGEREIMLGQASQPALSPNGARLAYRSWNINSRGIRVRELSEEGSWAWIPYHEAESPSWSPDSTNLTFSSQQESDRKWRLYRTLGLDIVRVERDGGDIFGRAPNWSADGRIIYWECPLGNCGLHAIRPDGTDSVRLTASEQDTAPAVSPDGSRLAFMSKSGDNWDIYLVSANRAGPDLQEPSRLTTNAARDGLPAWSPDGRWIAFASDRGGDWAVWAMRADGSRQRQLFALGGPLLGEVANVPPAEQHGWTSEALAWGE
ncbi:MAG: hypothetical protein PVI67_05515 [Anaerolineae bacterium]